MVEEQAFLAAIRSQPSETAPRLVYADWLEDRGHPLADVIRAEVALTSLSPLSPQYWEAKARARGLRKPVSDAALEPLGYGLAYLPMLSRMPDDRISRWRLLDRFLDYWGPESLGPHSGCPLREIESAERRLGVRAPGALREFYQLLGRRFSDPEAGDWLTPEDWRLSGNRLTFRHVIWVDWSIPLDAGDDPPVAFVEENRTAESGWRNVPIAGECGAAFSTFSLMTTVRDALYSAPVRADSGRVYAAPSTAASAQSDEFSKISQHLPRCDLPHQYCASRTLRFCEGRDVLVQLAEGQGIEVGARSGDAVMKLQNETRTLLSIQHVGRRDL